MKILFLFSMVALLTAKGDAQNKTIMSSNSCGVPAGFPIPAKDSSLLFYLQRSSNSNTVLYKLNRNSGDLDMRNPVLAQWIRYEEQGQLEDLNYIQNRYAYGVQAKGGKDGEIPFKIVGYKKLTLYLQSQPNKSYAWVEINKKRIIINRIFLSIEGGTFWFPNVVCIEIKGLDKSTREPITEIFTP